jgi:hypothetical protein
LDGGKTMDYHNELLHTLVINYEQNLKFLENQDPLLLNDSEYHKLYRAYWLSNVKIKNLIEIIEIMNQEE